MTFRVVLAEDDYLIREGTAALLAGQDGVEVVSTTADLDSLLAAVEEHLPDAVLTDIRMPPKHSREGIEGAHRIRRRHPQIGVVVLSVHVDGDYAQDLLKDGAAGLGYLLKERVVDIDQVVRALREVAAGGSVLDPKVVERLLSRDPRGVGSPLTQLTPKEREVLEQMAQGKTNASIAGTLFMSERVVERHVGSVFEKLGLTGGTDVHRRVMAVLAYLRQTGLRERERPLSQDAFGAERT